MPSVKAAVVAVTVFFVGGLSLATHVAAQEEPAEPIEGYTLIGADPAGDFAYKIAEQDDPVGLYGTGKIDIIRLDAGVDGDTLNLRMTLPGDTSYGGLGNHMWVVQFDVDGTSYEACWTILTAGTSAQSNDVAENIRGCSMFGSEDVGPRTKGDGVRVVQEEGQWFIEWPIPVDEVGGVGATMANIVASTWARSGDTDDSPPEYQFELHDVAPDEGAWTYVVGAAGGAEGALSLEADRANATAGPGSWLVFEVLAHLDGNVTSNVSFQASGPEGWEVEVVEGASPAGNETGNQTGNETGNPAGNETTTMTPGVAVHVGVPETAENGTYNVTIEASAGGNVSASLNLTITVDGSLEPVDERAQAMQGPTDAGGTGNETDGNATAQDADDALIPGPAPLLVAAAMAAAALVVRRRRETL